MVKRIVLVLAVAALGACSRPNIQNKDAVEKAVRQYLMAKQAQTGLDMNAMDIEVTSMSFEKDQAKAGVYFKLKNGDGGMEMQYALDRKGDQWVVRGLTGLGSGPHVPGSTAKAPGSDGGSDAPAQAPLPPNHPTIEGGAIPAGPLPGQLPAGHPPVGEKK
jgi:hypothetical protein